MKRRTVLVRLSAAGYDLRHGTRERGIDLTAARFSRSPNILRR